MKLIVIGTGYVGLVSGACFAELGHKVICVDKDERKIKILEGGGIPIYEPGLEDIVKKNRNTGSLSFTTSLKESLKGADAVLLAVGTPTDDKTGRADLTYVFAAAKEIAQTIDKALVVITKSTVPVGTGQELLKILKQTNPQLECEVASNPEFLREGSAVSDFMNPDRVIIGAESENTKNIMQKLYGKMIGQGIPVLFTNIATAELIKYSSNAFLAMKIAFANEISDICEGVGADVDLVIKGMGMDGRIGGKYMQPGPGYGGSCFPKDTMALTHIARDSGYPTNIIEAVIKSNDSRKSNMAKKIINACGGDVRGKEIAVLGLTFKANTDDMRYSPSLVIIPELIKAGAKIRAFDPVGMDEARKALLPPLPVGEGRGEGSEAISEVNALTLTLSHRERELLQFCESANEALKGADACAILTEWQEFRDIDLKTTKQLMKVPLIVDLRNLLDRKKAVGLGYQYVSIGR